MNDVAEKAHLFEGALDSLMKAINEALAEYGRLPLPGMEYSNKKWRDTALPLLSADLSTTRSCLSDVSNSGKLKELVRVASNELGLAKNLDTFRFDFAGATFDQRLNDEVSETVHAASELIKAVANQS